MSSVNSGPAVCTFVTSHVLLCLILFSYSFDMCRRATLAPPTQTPISARLFSLSPPPSLSLSLLFLRQGFTL